MIIFPVLALNEKETGLLLSLLYVCEISYQLTITSALYQYCFHFKTKKFLVFLFLTTCNHA